jgi:hypothetical protein
VPALQNLKKSRRVSIAGGDMVVDIMVPSHSVIRSHKAADFFVIFGNFDNPATWCWKDES